MIMGDAREVDQVSEQVTPPKCSGGHRTRSVQETLGRGGAGACPLRAGAADRVRGIGFGIFELEFVCGLR